MIDPPVAGGFIFVIADKGGLQAVLVILTIIRCNKILGEQDSKRLVLGLKLVQFNF